MSRHPFVNHLRTHLDSCGISYSYWEHDPVRTSDEAHVLFPDYEISQGAKSLLLCIKFEGNRREYVECIIPGDEKFDSNKVANYFNAKSCRFATQEESDELTGSIEFGGVPPFGNLFPEPVQVIVDPKVLRHTEIIFNAGDRSVSMAMSTSDWQTVVNPVVREIVK